MHLFWGIQLEDRIRALEGQFTGLTANIKLLTWLGGIAALALVAWLGATSIYTIPNQVVQLLATNGLDDAKTKLAALVTEAEELRDQTQTNANAVSTLLTDMQAGGIQLYQCPKDLSGGAEKWMSYGCLGQISSLSTCTNEAWTGGRVTPVTRQCEPIEVFARPKAAS